VAALQNHLSTSCYMRFLFPAILFLGFSLSFSSCSENQTARHREEAFERYRNFVMQVEREAGRKLTDTLAQSRAQQTLQQNPSDSSWWQSEITELQQQYDEQRRRLEPNISHYDTARRKEIDELEQRYNRAYLKQQHAYRQISRRYALRWQLLEIPVEKDDFSHVDAHNIVETYSNFVTQLENKKDNLSAHDWELITGWWLSLNNRKRALENTLSKQALRSLAQLQQQYREIRQYAPQAAN